MQQLKRQRTGATADSGESAAPVQEMLGSKVSSVSPSFPPGCEAVRMVLRVGRGL